MPDITSLISSLAPSYGVPPSLAIALAQKESALNPNAVGSAGEIGLFQIKPSTAGMTAAALYDPTQNTIAAMSYLQSLYNQFGNWNDALVAYNEGPTAFSQHGAYTVSQAYANSILSAAGIDSSGDLGITSDLSPSPDTFTSLDLSSLTGLSAGAVFALVGIVGVVLVLLFRD